MLLWKISSYECNWWMRRVTSCLIFTCFFIIRFKTSKEFTTITVYILWPDYHYDFRWFTIAIIIRAVDSQYLKIPENLLLLVCVLWSEYHIYINNNIIKDRCPIPLDATVMLGPLKFNLQATIDHHGPSIDSGHYTASINCCKKTFYCNDYKITEFGITDKNSSTAYIILYKWIDTWFLDSDRRVGVWSLPWRWHILSIPLTTGRGTSAETCGLDDVFPPDDLGSRPETLC